MAVQAIAVVNSEGAIESAYVPGAIYPADGTADETDSLRTIRHINSGFSDMSTWVSLMYWKDGAWQARDPAPDPLYYDWKDEKWNFNSTNFWNLVRRDRNQRLYSSDWTQLDDCKLSMTKKGEWAEYRQALREVPVNNSGSTMLDQVVWPDQPS